MAVKLVQYGNWCEEGRGPVLRFRKGDIYRGPDQDKLVKAGWAEKVVNNHDDAMPPIHSVLGQTMDLVLFVPVCDADFFKTADGEDIPADMVSYGTPIDTKEYSSGLYFGFAAPGLPNGGGRVFKILHSDDIDGGYEPVHVENLVYGKDDGRFPTLYNRYGEMAGEGIPFIREGIVGVRRYVKIALWAGGVRGGSAIAVAIRNGKTIPIPDNRSWYDDTQKASDEIEALCPGTVLFAQKDDEPEPEIEKTVEDANRSTEDSDVKKAYRQVFDEIVARSESEKSAKFKIASYAQGAFGITVDRRKKLDQVIDEILTSIPDDAPEPEIDDVAD